MDKVLVICGPTATGKTALAAQLAKKFNGELISADSRQVYRGMDLVTGKDKPDVQVWLYNVVNPDEEFSVSQWVKLAHAAIGDIINRKKLPIVIGGTGLYIKGLLQPFDTIDIPPNKELRKKLERLQVSDLQGMVEKGSMNNSDWNNPRRLIRKIEIAEEKSLCKKQENRYDALLIGLTTTDSVLDERIDVRFKERLEKGMKEEIEYLVNKYGREYPSMSAIGLNEHAYARRQMTWFKKQKDIQWFDISDPEYEHRVADLVGAWYTRT